MGGGGLTVSAAISYNMTHSKANQCGVCSAVDSSHVLFRPHSHCRSLDEIQQVDKQPLSYVHLAKTYNTFQDISTHD